MKTIVESSGSAEMPDEPDRARPQVKICGLTRVDEALACVEAGASAIGLVFYARSPRCVGEAQAREICQKLPPEVPGVGVFVDEPLEELLRIARRCGLKAMQLHGRESDETVLALRREGLTVIKALFVNGTPSFAEAEAFHASAYLVECTGGPLPGGNAKAWRWEAAEPLSRRHPVVLAGGLSPENVAAAIEAAAPDAVDVSSGVESEPGRKDVAKVRRFLAAVAQGRTGRELRRIFL